FHGIASRLGIEGQFTEIRDFVGKRGSQVKIELAKVEAADGASLVRRGKIHLAKSANLQRRVASLQLPRGGLRLSLLVLMHGRGGRRRLGHFRLWSFRGWNGRCNSLSFKLPNAFLQLLNALEQNPDLLSLIG